MDTLRVIVACLLSVFSAYLVYDLFVNGFDLVVLLTAIVGFVLVHFIWPPKREVDSAWLDILELIVDLPYKAFALLLRSIGHIVKGASDSGLD